MWVGERKAKHRTLYICLYFMHFLLSHQSWVMGTLIFSISIKWSTEIATNKHLHQFRTLHLLCPTTHAICLIMHESLPPVASSFLPAPNTQLAVSTQFNSILSIHSFYLLVYNPYTTMAVITGCRPMLSFRGLTKFSRDSQRWSYDHSSGKQLPAPVCGIIH